MSEFVEPLVIDRKEIFRRAARHPLSFVPLVLEVQAVIGAPSSEEELLEDDYRQFWQATRHLDTTASRLKNLDGQKWPAIYSAEQLQADALTAVHGVAIASRTCGLSSYTQQALATQCDFPERLGQSPAEAVATAHRLDIFAQVMIQGSGRQLSALGLVVCQGNATASRLLQRRYQSSDPLAHMTAPRIVETLQSGGMLGSIAPDKREAARDIAKGYQFWSKLYNHYAPLAGEIPEPAIVRNPVLMSPVEMTPATNTDFELERLTQKSTALRARHAELMTPFHIPAKREKQLYRPFIRGILHEVRLDTSTVVTPDGVDGTVFSKRLAAIVYGIQKVHKKYHDDPEKIRELLLAERTVYQRLTEADAQLEELIVETPEHVLSLDMMLEWIRDNPSIVGQALSSHWPSNPDAAHKDIQAILSCKKELDNELKTDPRKRLYALAKQLGSIALPKETRETQSSVIRHYRIDPETASSGLDDLIHRTKDRLIQERARVVDYFLNQASSLAEQTGDSSYGLYFAEVASDTRDRYFIVKCRDDQNRDWFVLETLEGERATYVIPSEVAWQVLGPFEAPEKEIEAIIRNNKTDARALGDAGGYRAQIIHQNQWTSQSHVQKILQRMNNWQP